MTRQIAQLGAMIKYELLMSWRRRSLIITLVFLLLSLVVFTISWAKEPLAAGDKEVLYVDDTVTPATVTMYDQPSGETITIPADDVILTAIPHWLRNTDLRQANATLKIVSLLAIATQLMVIMLLLMNAETIPLDKHYRVRELLNTLPLGRAAYLGGKLLGVWIGLLVGLIICMILYIPVAQSQFGAFDISLYVRLWFAVLLPGAIFASGISVIGASGASTRRMAVLIGLALIPVGVFVFALIIVAIFTPLLNMGAAQFQGFTYETFANSLISNVAQTMLWANVAMLAFGVVAWGIMRFREGR
jgi:hypothetical protein